VRGRVVLTDLVAQMLDVAVRRAAAQGIAAFARVLRPGSRLCSSVWVKPEANPWSAIAMRAIAAEAVAPTRRTCRGTVPGLVRCVAGTKPAPTLR
jgi:SAM-dependent methyltransferase